MKLIVECIQDNLEYLIEDVQGQGKDCYISGVFMQAETPNRNKRRYPIKIVEREVAKYNKNFIEQNRAVAELGHPQDVTVNLERVSHLIKELKMDGNNVIGKAKILDTPYGKIAKSLIQEGVKLAVSTRGTGSLKEGKGGIQEVQDDFSLSAIDIVADPSAPEAFVNGVMESKEWVWDNGIIKPVEIENYKKQIQQAKKKETQTKFVELFQDFMKKVSK